ncbi:DUF3618 domain-containing protein [Lentzea sp. NPDC051838]|uniref:DUF3618 domain-containing protein n=1 Tax=Lentzea sp. NPDC051838 TaxID=3154849 RepID=UPI003441B9A0
MNGPREDLQHEVERTRQELGETVEALAHKADVPGRVKAQVQRKPLPSAVLAAAFIGVVLLIWKLSRRNG